MIGRGPAKIAPEAWYAADKPEYRTAVGNISAKSEACDAKVAE